MVSFTTEFKVVMTTVMIVDYVGCYLVENLFKYAFSDFRPKDIAVRRPDQVQAEEARLAQEAAAAAEEEEGEAVRKSDVDSSKKLDIKG